MRETVKLLHVLTKVTDFYYATIGFDDWLWMRSNPKTTGARLV